MLEGGELRDYQMQGLRWMVGLADHGLNGILADEMGLGKTVQMGLGKTVQVIAMICHLLEARGEGPPFLIAAPASVLPNWAAELARWAPRLRVVAYKGGAAEREATYNNQARGCAIARGPKFHVLLTSYDFLMSKADRPRLARGREWRCIVIDEGHRLKNADCKLARELKQYRSRARLLLTGARAHARTPLQNKIDELWALLNFLMPDMFNSAEDFAAWFGQPMEALRGCGGAARGDGAPLGALLEEYLLLTSRLHTVLRPFMLRRLKESVAGELPGKTEVVLRCKMSPYQEALYSLVTRSFAGGDAGGGDDKGGGGGGGGGRGLGVSVNNALMELRTICNHPLIRRAPRRWARRLHPQLGETLLPPAPLGLPPGLRLSAKVEALDRVLVRMAAGGHKVLLFCTMTRVLDELETYLGWRGHSFLRLDGTSGGAGERGELVRRFNDPASGVFVFLLSIRAGGVGLNLQAADTVIMYDTDWNPQIDLQAQARAYRIGQTRPVLVVRLVTGGTVEEHVQRVAAEKAKFADSSITGGFFDGMTSADDRRKYLLSILNAPPDAPPGATASGGGDGGSGLEMGDGELSALLARGAGERGLFDREDARRGAAEAAAAARWAAERGGAALVPAAAAGVAAVPRLASAEDCSALIREAAEAAAPKPKDDPTMYGRGMRGAAAAVAPAAAPRPDPRPAPAASVQTAPAGPAEGGRRRAAVPSGGGGRGGGGRARAPAASAPVKSRSGRRRGGAAGAAPTVAGAAGSEGGCEQFGPREEEPQGSCLTGPTQVEAESTPVPPPSAAAPQTGGGGGGGDDDGGEEEVTSPPTAKGHGGCAAAAIGRGRGAALSPLPPLGQMLPQQQQEGEEGEVEEGQTEEAPQHPSGGGQAEAAAAGCGGDARQQAAAAAARPAAASRKRRVVAGDAAAVLAPAPKRARAPRAAATAAAPSVGVRTAAPAATAPEDWHRPLERPPADAATAQAVAALLHARLGPAPLALHLTTPQAQVAGLLWRRFSLEQPGAVAAGALGAVAAQSVVGGGGGAAGAGVAWQGVPAAAVAPGAAPGLEAAVGRLMQARGSGGAAAGAGGAWQAVPVVAVAPGAAPGLEAAVGRLTRARGGSGGAATGAGGAWQAVPTLAVARGAEPALEAALNHLMGPRGGAGAGKRRRLTR
ncbi:MAG: P-loop containing nucleoside triphosphate hydrolase protein [Monoraphidium minutum]|nr:MAG: P-loop containing nucleoside triphosphate hydrolase protein [Monoraphidium minutum]